MPPGNMTMVPEHLRHQIDESFRKASGQQARLKQADRRYGTVQTTLGGLSTLIAGTAAGIGGPAIAGNWRVICAAAAVTAFGATIATVTQKQRSDPELLAHVSECVGKLRSLRVAALDPGSTDAELNGRYRQILTEYDRVEC